MNFDEILKHVETQRKQITAARGPDPALQEKYAQTLKRFNDYRGFDLWHPFLGTGRGNGALVELADGSVKYDFISGIGVHFGHMHPALIKASLEAAVQDTVMQGNLQQNVDSFELMEKMLSLSGLDHCFLTSSGSMANENALKIVFQKKFPANRLLAFERTFAGRTLSLATLSDKPSYREKLPSTITVDYLPFYDWKEPEKSQKWCLETLKKHLKRYPKQHAGMILELIQGEGGFYPGSREFFWALIEVLRENNIAVFVDEIQTFGRTENPFAFQNFGLHDMVDVVTVGKIFQLAATLFRKEFKPAEGLLSQTVTAATSSIRASKAILDLYETEKYWGPDGKIRQLRNHFVNHLKAISERHPDLLEGPFGYGLMIALTPFQGDPKRVTCFVRELFEAGVIAFISGDSPLRVRFLVPAGGVTFADIDEVAKIIETTLLH